MTNLKYPYQLKLHSNAPWPKVTLPNVDKDITKDDWNIANDSSEFRKYKPIRKYLIIENYTNNMDNVMLESDAQISQEEIDDLNSVVVEEEIEIIKESTIEDMLKNDLVDNIYELTDDYTKSELSGMLKKELAELYKNFINIEGE